MDHSVLLNNRKIHGQAGNIAANSGPRSVRISDVPAARNKMEFNVLNPYLIVLAGPAFLPSPRKTHAKSTRRSRHNLAFVNAQCANDN
jgi:hypothetical protein